jgi:hypothetical protein
VCLSSETSRLTVGVENGKVKLLLLENLGKEKKPLPPHPLPSRKVERGKGLSAPRGYHSKDRETLKSMRHHIVKEKSCLKRYASQRVTTEKRRLKDNGRLRIERRIEIH